MKPETRLWGGALALVLLGHAGVLAPLLLQTAPQASPTSAPPAPLALTLAPLASAHTEANLDTVPAPTSATTPPPSPQQKSPPSRQPPPELPLFEIDDAAVVVPKPASAPRSEAKPTIESVAKPTTVPIAERKPTVDETLLDNASVETPRQKPEFDKPEPDNDEQKPVTEVSGRRSVAIQAATKAARTTNPIQGHDTAANTEIRNDWQNAIMAHLAREKRYPRLARIKRQQGIAYVRFFIDRRGGVHQLELLRETGHAPLNREALALVSRAAPLPAPPPSLAGDSIELVMPIEFYLR